MNTALAAEIQNPASPLSTPKGSQASGETKSPWLAILFLAAALRFIVIGIAAMHHPRTWFFAQSTELAALAQSLLIGQGLSSPFGGSTGPSAFLAPGYPIFIAFIFKLFGSYSTASAIVIMTVQGLFGVATVVALMDIARHVFGKKVSNVAGTLWAVSPSLLWLPILFWETSFSTMALALILAMALRCSKQPTRDRWLLLGGATAIACLVNPALAIAIFAILTWAIHQPRATARSGAVPALLLGLVLYLPWPMRNGISLHAFVPFRSNLGYELWQGNRTGSRGFFSPQLHPNVNGSEFALYTSLGELSYMHEKSVAAQTEIRSDPARFIRLTFKRMACFWIGVGDNGSSSVVILHILITTLGSVVGFLLLPRNRHVPTLLFLIPMLLFPLPYYLTHPDPRFRLVIDPLATILTAYAMVSLRTRYSERRVRQI